MCTSKILKRRELITDFNMWADDINLWLLECAEYEQVAQPVVISNSIILQIKLDRVVEYIIPRSSLVIGFILPLILCLV